MMNKCCSKRTMCPTSSLLIFHYSLRLSKEKPPSPDEEISNVQGSLRSLAFFTDPEGGEPFSSPTGPRFSH